MRFVLPQYEPPPETVTVAGAGLTVKFDAELPDPPAVVTEIAPVVPAPAVATISVEEFENSLLKTVDDHLEEDVPEDQPFTKETQDVSSEENWFEE